MLIFLIDIDWDMTSSLLHYSIEDCMRVDAREYPILLAENYFDTNTKKDKVIFPTLPFIYLLYYILIVIRDSI